MPYRRRHDRCHHQCLFYIDILMHLCQLIILQMAPIIMCAIFSQQHIKALFSTALPTHTHTHTYSYSNVIHKFPWQQYISLRLSFSPCVYRRPVHVLLNKLNSQCQAQITKKLAHRDRFRGFDSNFNI